MLAGCAVLGVALAAPLTSSAVAPAKTTPGEPTTVAPVDTAPAPTGPAVTVPPPTAPSPTAPSLTVPPASVAPTLAPPVLPIADVIDEGNAKPERFYDAYLSAALADIQSWWAAQYPVLYGTPFEPLAGGIYAAYPERTDPIPGCGGGPTTSYQDVSNYAAFYCPLGDFMAYDDGTQGVIYQLASTYSPSVVAVVMAHEYGHAIQERTGDLERNIPTVVTEQQADCFSGAWAGHVWRDNVPGLPFNDEDIRTGLISLVTVRDPIGASALEPGGHGSAFDRIGAFSEGFIGGIEKCTGLIDKPLPLLSNEFSSDLEQQTQGNAPFGYDDGQAMGIVVNDLNQYFPAQLQAAGATVPVLTLRPVTDPANDNCGQARLLALTGAVYCPASNEILFHEAVARELYDDFGDFAVGYPMGHAWADAAQAALASPLTGEARSLVSDCMVGAWVSGALKWTDPVSAPPIVDLGYPRDIAISPGDLDEAVQTALVLGDATLDQNLDGSAFEKIAYMRIGVLDGFTGCLNLMGR